MKNLLLFPFFLFSFYLFLFFLVPQKALAAWNGLSANLTTTDGKNWSVTIVNDSNTNVGGTANLTFYTFWCNGDSNTTCVYRNLDYRGLKTAQNFSVIIPVKTIAGQDMRGTNVVSAGTFTFTGLNGKTEFPCGRVQADVGPQGEEGILGGAVDFTTNEGTGNCPTSASSSCSGSPAALLLNWNVGYNDDPQCNIRVNAAGTDYRVSSNCNGSLSGSSFASGALTIQNSGVYNFTAGATNGGIATCPIPEPLEPPEIPVPTGLLASCANLTGTINFSWNPVTGAARYAIRVNDLGTTANPDFSDDNVSATVAAGATRVSYAWTGATAGHNYQWWVYTIDSAENFSGSSVIASVSCAAAGCTTLSVSPTSLSFTVGDSGATLTASGGQGTLSWSTGNSSIATVSPIGNQATVTPGNTAGTTFITARDTGSGGCTAETVSVSVTVRRAGSCGSIQSSCCYIDPVNNIGYECDPNSVSNQCASLSSTAKCEADDAASVRGGFCVQGTYNSSTNTCPAPTGGADPVPIPVPTLAPIVIIAPISGPTPPPQLYRVEGVAFIDTNRNSRQDSGEECYNGQVRVHLLDYSTGREIAVRAHNQDRNCGNKYAFSNLPIGNYRLVMDSLEPLGWLSTLTPAWTRIFGLPYAAPAPTPVPPTPTPAPLPPSTAYKRVFITSTTHNGNLGGLEGGDSICETQAWATNLRGTWKAWLSGQGASAATRLTHASVPYKLLNGTIVADSWIDLTDGTLDNPISINENNTACPSYEIAWTGTYPDGSASSGRCGDWWLTGREGISTAGTAGQCNSSVSNWSSAGSSYECSGLRHLYCFEQ